jgi:nucleobase transporter 1/2
VDDKDPRNTRRNNSGFVVAFGFSGIMSFALKYIGPLSITPIISLTGFSLIPVGYDLASGQWWIALMTMFIVLLFSQYLKTNTIPNRPCSSIKNMKLSVFACLNFFPVLLALAIEI